MEQQEKFWDEVHCQDSQNTKEPDDWILSSAESMKIIETKILQPMIKTRNNNNNNNKIRLLIAGCGTSNLGIDLYKKYSNILNITNIDISNVAISTMKNKCPNNNNMKFFKVDCCKLKEYFNNDDVNNQKFDVVIDKGTADTLLFRVKRNKSYKKICQYFDGVQEILANNGHFLIISPRKKMYKLNSYCWNNFYTLKFQNKIEHNNNMLVKQRQCQENLDRSVYIHHCIKSDDTNNSLLHNNNKATINTTTMLKMKYKKKYMLIEHEIMKSILNNNSNTYNLNSSDEVQYLQSIYNRFNINPSTKVIEEDDENNFIIQQLFDHRLKCRKNKEYDTSDVLRLYLKCKYNVLIEDRKETSIWWKV